MKNWKTTLFGIGAAIILIVIDYIAKHTIDMPTLISALGLAGVGAAASDAPTQIQTIAAAAAAIPELKTATAKEIIGLADSTIDLTSAAHPTNVLLTDIKTGIDTLNQNINAAPAAAAPVVEITNTNGAPDVIEEAAPIATEPTELEKAQAVLQAAQDAVNALSSSVAAEKVTA